MTRYLVRLENRNEYTPRDIARLSTRVRETLGSRENASHFRVSSNALEFNLFARNETELETRKSLLERQFSKIIDLIALDKPPVVRDQTESFQEGVQLFNQERFWESQEVFEQVWNTATGEEREILQGLILTGAAFVHYQKGEDDICLSILKRARAKLGSHKSIAGIDLEKVRDQIDESLASNQPQLFKIHQSVSNSKIFLST